MSTNANPAPTETVKVSPKITAAINAVVKAEVSYGVALDGYRNVAKSECVRLALTDKKALTAVLFASGDKDARRVSEIVGFVFPASTSARKELDKAMEINARQTDIKKRVPKQVLLALQRDKTGKLTLDAAIKAAKDGVTGERQPGGQTTQTETKKKKKTPAEIEEELTIIIQQAMKFAKENGYDAADFNAVVESIAEEAFAEAEETEGEGEGETAED